METLSPGRVRVGFYLALVMFTAVLANTRNTQDICNRDPEDTGASKTPGDNGFRIKVSGTPQPDLYTPEQVYTVTINGTYAKQKLLGFMLVAVPRFATDETTAMGTFQNLNLGLTKAADRCPHVIMHTYQHPKAGIEVLWTAPRSGSGCIEFRASVIEYKDIWYKDDGALTKVFCEDMGMGDSQAPEMMPECCACGTGKYQMTFHGLWSRHTHPKEFPSQNKRLLHWSNIVGASHGKKYQIWEYGEYASKGVKEVCEFGYPRTLEQEMRQHSHDVRTVIKTPGIWWKDPHGLRQTRWARFSVDKKNHLLSMLTMIGPSPDWCVGVSSLNLCLPNCTWAGDMNIELYPWDAGTDEGITYMSQNMKSDPPQKIHKITHQFPENKASPFFSPRPIKPLAVLELRRIHPKPGSPPTCHGNDTEPDEESSFDAVDITDMEMKKKLMMMKGKCAVSDWGDWSECSVTCGVGDHFRKRMYLNPMVNEDMCGLPVMDTEPCIGIENECEGVNEECALTGWSDWSPCSVTCAKGTRERHKRYMRKMDMLKCDRETREVEMCMAKVFDCDTVVRNVTAICSQRKYSGICTGNFTRWYYDTDMKKCLEFTYGGCRGNENRFQTREECMETCMTGEVEDPVPPTATDVALSSPPARDCMLSPWSSWSECSKTCGKGYKYKRRFVKVEPSQGGKPCHKKMEKKKGCTIQKCRSSEHKGPMGCVATSWSEWSICSSTCGRAFKYKRRMIKQKPEEGGKKCPTKLERKKKCTVPKCPRDCALGPWSEWTACAKTCGYDSIQERSRPILHHARRGGEECGPRLERRYCDLQPCPEDLEGGRRQKRRRNVRRGS